MHATSSGLAAKTPATTRSSISISALRFLEYNYVTSVCTHTARPAFSTTTVHNAPLSVCVKAPTRYQRTDVSYLHFKSLSNQACEQGIRLSDAHLIHLRYSIYGLSPPILSFHDRKDFPRPSLSLGRKVLLVEGPGKQKLSASLLFLPVLSL